MWLLPVVFMVHDFEEIIMMRPWIDRNSGFLRERFPRLAQRIVGQMEKLSTSSFAFAVAEEFLIISIVTFLAVEYQWYAVWGGMLVGFFAHIVVHFAQFIAVRRYVPVIFTSVPAAIYCGYALHYMLTGEYFSWATVWPWALVFTVFIAVNIMLVHKLAARFELWLRR